MQSIQKITLFALIAMGLVSFANFFGSNLAGLAVFIGVAFFFIQKILDKQPFRGSGLDFGAIKTNLKDKSIWVWIALPLIMDAVSITLATLFLPDYIEHVRARASAFVSFDQLGAAALQMVVLALGEEIAWRAFFQKQLSKVLPVAPVVLLSSVLFALGHLTAGQPAVVIFDLFFVFVNSVLYGIIFQKTNNAWVSTLSHYLANLFSVIVFLFL